jgi:hypothetical protein
MATRHLSSVLNNIRRHNGHSHLSSVLGEYPRVGVEVQYNAYYLYKYIQLVNQDYFNRYKYITICAIKQLPTHFHLAQAQAGLRIFIVLVVLFI